MLQEAFPSQNDASLIMQDSKFRKSFRDYKKIAIPEIKRLDFSNFRKSEADSPKMYFSDRSETTSRLTPYYSLSSTR